MSLLAISIFAGCGADDTTDEAAVPPAYFVSAIPPSGSEIAVNGSITLTFDNAPLDITVNAGTAVPSGKTVTIKGPFAPGTLNLTVTWADGTQMLTYTVIGVDCCGPIVTGGTVSDGDKDVDPAGINSDGIIEITFSEEMTGHIALQTENGDNVGWIGKVEGTKGTLELVKGRELINATVYVIVGKISDAAGVALNVSVTFVTKGKE